MLQLDTDYLVIGSGAVGLAFADTLLAETDAHITIVDRHGKPGGHWNDAYSFVALHQPSAFYGVNSLELGTNRKDMIGVNKGLYELASGPEVSGYFDKVMHQMLLPSGRVDYHPMCNYLGDGRFISILSGLETQVAVRKKIVDASYHSPTVPATHTPKYRVGEGVRLVTPNALPQLWQAQQEAANNFVIIGAGKTGMDVGVWLLNSGAKPDAIHWVMPRDSWLLNRLQIQPGEEFFKESIGSQANQMEAFANATSMDDLFARMEACDTMLRIDPDRKPSMFHFATISKGELDLLRNIKNVIRKGHVQSIEPGRMVLDQGVVATPANTLYIDCTACAVETRLTQPIFQGDNIILQLVRMPAPLYSAALVAYVEAHYDTDAQKNQLCVTIPFTDNLEVFARAAMSNMLNQLQCGQDEELRLWIRDSRLDGFGKLVAGVDPADAEKQAILAKFETYAMAALANIPKLIGCSTAV